MDLGIAGKVAFVSGGSKGIGRATAELLASEGVKVVVVATGSDAIAETVAAMIARGGEAVGVTADLTEPAEIERAVRETADAFGLPDIVVFNGVSPRGGPLHGEPGAARYKTGVHGDFFDVSDEELANAGRRVLTVSCLTRAVAPHMKEQRWGRLVNIGTSAPKEPPPDLPHILASTGAASVVTLQKSLSNELGPYGITVNYLGAGFIGTQNMYDYVDMLAQKEETTREIALHRWTSTIPLRRVGTPEEMAAVVAFLCSQGAGYITGEFIGVHGGILRSAF